MLSRSGFFNIWVHPLDWEDFAIEFEGKWYVYTTLVFGWRPSASIYHICMGAVCSYLRTELHCPITHWIDDSTGSSRRRPGVVLDDSLVESPTSPGVPLPFSLIEANNASFLAATVMQGVGYFLSIAATCSVLGFYGKTQPFGLLSLTYLGYVLHLRLGGVPGRRGVGTPAKKALKYDVLRAAVAAGLRAGVLPTYTDLERVVCRYDSLRLQFPLMRLLLTACWAALGGEQRASRAEGSVVRRSQRLGHGAVLRADGPGAMAVMAAELDAIDFVTDAVVPLRWSRHVLAQLSVKRSRAHDGSCRVVATWRGPAGSWELGPATWEGAAADADAGVLAATAAALEEGALGPGVTDLRVELHCGDPFLLRVLLASAWALRCSIPGVGRIHHALRARNWDVVSCVREDVLFRPPRAGWGRGGSYMGLTRDVTRRVSDAFPSLAVDYFCEPWSAQFDTYVTRFPHARVEAALPPPLRGGHVDAFRLPVFAPPGPAVSLYCCPPIAMVRPWLSLLAESGLACCLVLQVDQSASWYPELLAQAVGRPLVLARCGTRGGVYVNYIWDSAGGLDIRFIDMPLGHDLCCFLVDGRRSSFGGYGCTLTPASALPPASLYADVPSRAPVPGAD